MLEDLPRSIKWEEGKLFFLDQTLLPNQLVYEQQKTVAQVESSIKQLKVRGAPAIGIAAAYGLVIGAKSIEGRNDAVFFQQLHSMAERLQRARPTAVNLHWAIARLIAKVQENTDKTPSQIVGLLENEAKTIHEEDRQLCYSIGKHAVDLIKENMGVLTHCNAGSLAVSELGTALAPLYLAHERGITFRAYASETRPLLQGARLSAWELHQAGLDVTVITDNMAAHIMHEGCIDLIIVGTDRVAANGDVANKIGTLGLAILAKHFNIPFYVACPSSTLDLSSATGQDIVIEERNAEEVRTLGQQNLAPLGVKCRNPAFDVTPQGLITGLITEKGLFPYPYAQKLGQH